MRPDGNLPVALCALALLFATQLFAAGSETKKPDGKALRGYEEAIGEFAKALSFNPNLKEAYKNLGYCFRRVGKLPHSLDAYDKAIALDPDFAQAREYRGETYLALGQPDKAEAELAKLHELKSKYAEQLALAIGMYRNREKQATAGR